MEPVKAKDIPTEKQIFSDAWQLLTQYYYLTETEDDSGWDEALNRANEICRAFESNPAAFALSKKIIVGVLSYIETRGRSGSDRQGGTQF